MTQSLSVRWIAIVLAALISVALLGACAYGSAQSAYERGDKVEALRQFRIAAEGGHREAQYRLAMMYRYGDGVPVRMSSAALWFHSAYWRVPAAAYELAIIYEQGLTPGATPNLERAIHFYRHAADRGHAGAQAALARLGATEPDADPAWTPVR